MIYLLFIFLADSTEIRYFTILKRKHWQPYHQKRFCAELSQVKESFQVFNKQLVHTVVSYIHTYLIQIYISLLSGLKFRENFIKKRF